MFKFYATFMNKQPLAKHYVEILADDVMGARAAMELQFGRAYGFMYDAEAFAGQPEKYDLKKLFTLRVEDFRYEGEEYGLWTVKLVGETLFCKNHPVTPARENIDGDNLCQECCNNWVKAEAAK